MPRHNKKLDRDAKKLKFPKTETEKRNFENIIFDTYSQMEDTEDYKIEDLENLLLDFMNQESPKHVLYDFKKSSHTTFKKVKEISGVPNGTANRMNSDDTVNYKEGSNHYTKGTILKIATAFIDDNDENNYAFDGQFNINNFERLLFACDPYERINGFKEKYYLSIYDQINLDKCILKILRLSQKEY